MKYSPINQSGFIVEKIQDKGDNITQSKRGDENSSDFKKKALFFADPKHSYSFTIFASLLSSSSLLFKSVLNLSLSLMCFCYSFMKIHNLLMQSFIRRSVRHWRRFAPWEQPYRRLSSSSQTLLWWFRYGVVSTNTSRLSFCDCIMFVTRVQMKLRILLATT